MEKREYTAKDDDKESVNQIIKTSKALGSLTRFEILRLLSKDEMDISRIAESLNQTEANISAQVKHLENADLVTCFYKPGEHGVRKICSTKVSSITINIVETE
jgi:predicted transcriptional regulator